MNENCEESFFTELNALQKATDDIGTATKRLSDCARQPPFGRLTPLEAAKRHYQGRRQRSVMFGETHLFGEPVWDMLIDLFIAAEENKEVSVSSLCIAADVPATTALRYITMLEDMKLIERSCDGTDRRRFYLSLEQGAHESVRNYFEQFG